MNSARPVATIESHYGVSVRIERRHLPLLIQLLTELVQDHTRPDRRLSEMFAVDGHLEDVIFAQYGEAGYSMIGCEYVDDKLLIVFTSLGWEGAIKMIRESDETHIVVVDEENGLTIELI